MAGWNSLITAAGLGLLAVGTSCSAPVAAPPAEEGQLIGQETLDGFVHGITTREQVLMALGPPTSQKANAQDGSTTLAWHYVHTDAKGTLSILTLMQFDAQDKLLFKGASRDTRSR